MQMPYDTVDAMAVDHYLADMVYNGPQGVCLYSYTVTLGATALATTIDYSSAASYNCSYQVSTQVAQSGCDLVVQ